MLIANMAAEAVELVNKRYEEAFDLIRYVFKVDHLYEDQIRLIKAFDGKNIFFSAPTGYGKSIKRKIGLDFFAFYLRLAFFTRISAIHKTTLKISLSELFFNCVEFLLGLNV